MENNNKPQYTIEDYIHQNPRDAHIKLFIQLKLTTDPEFFKTITDDMVLHFDMGGIRYEISMGDLKQKCREESANYYSYGNGGEED